MKERVFNVVAMLNPAVWNKWPLTDDVVFKDVFSITSEVRKPWAPGIVVNMHYAPVYAPRYWAGLREPRPVWWDIDNRVPAPTKIYDGMMFMLKELAKTADVILWPDARECWPEIARELPELFPIRILTHADDCIWSSPVRTFPVARYFTHLIHWMHIYNQESGVLVQQMYEQNGLPAERCYHGGYGGRSGVDIALSDIGFDGDSLAERAQKIAEGDASFRYDLGFVGALGLPGFRLEWLKRLNAAAPPSPKFALHGLGMRDGRLMPLDHPKGIGYPTAEFYLRAFSTLNIGLSSIFNNRLWDAWRCGVLQFVVDPHEELATQGFDPHEHYVPYDGQPEGLAAAVDVWKSQPAKAATVIRQGYDRCNEHLESHDLQGSVFRILQDVTA